MPLDIARVRQDFPALDEGVAFFDGPGGTQVPRQVAEAVASTLVGGLANRGEVTLGEQRAEAVVREARAAVADLLGCEEAGVAFGRSMTQLTYDAARALARQWRTGDEVVVTRLDHDANVRPWIQAAEAVGAVVRWVEFDPESADLSVDDVRAALSERTRLVAVTGAANTLGTRPDLPVISEAVHERGALLFVDGVHLTPHVPVDLAALGADLFACSAYKFLGPHLGILAADPRLLEQLRPDKLLPSPDRVPERFELGTLPYELLAGTTAAVDYLADVSGVAEAHGLAGANGRASVDEPADPAADRRSRVLTSMVAVAAHEDALFARLLDGLRSLDRVRIFGDPQRRTPTAYFTLEGHEDRAVYEHLARQRVNVPASTFYALEASRWIGRGDAGALRAGLAVYSTEEEVDRLLAGLAELLR